MKELRLPLDFSPTLFNIINWYYLILANKVTKFIAKYYTIVSHNFKAKKVTKFIAKY
jgi:hypothetical protein